LGASGYRIREPGTRRSAQRDERGCGILLRKVGGCALALHATKCRTGPSALLETRKYAESLVQDTKEGPSRANSALDPLTALIPLSIQIWYERLGVPARFLHDCVKLLTPSFVQTMLYGMWHLHQDFRRLVKPARVASFWVGNSADHPSIQLADLYASAGRVIVEAHLGAPSETAAILGDPVRKLVTFGVLPDDSFWAEASP
jgi:hypothetical protein